MSVRCQITTSGGKLTATHRRREQRDTHDLLNQVLSFKVLFRVRRYTLTLDYVLATHYFAFKHFLNVLKHSCGNLASVAEVEGQH